jgi:hypothetical protein
MLNQNTLAAALTLTERLEAARMALYPVSGSPLDAMVNATRSDPSLLEAAGGDMNVFIATVSTMANKVQEVYGASHHSATLDQIGELAITSVRNHLAFAKTVVVPVINDLYTRVQASLADVNASALLGMEVEVLCEPPPLESAQLQSAVRKFDGLTLEDLPLTLHLPDQTCDELKEMVSTGSKQMDSAIAEWLAKDDGILTYIWEHVFQQRPVEKPTSFLTLITDRQYGVQNALAIYLLARKLVDGKPMPGTQMPLGVYKSRIADFRNQAGAALSRALDRIDRAMKAGILVRDVVKGTKTVVYEPLYRKFLEEGGTNEVLFANALGGGSYLTSAGDLVEKKAELLERWNLHAGLVKTAEANKRFNKTKDFIELHFNAQLAEIAGSDEGTAGNIEAVRRLFDGVMAGIRTTDLDDLYTLCLKIVCRARFFKTDAEKILLGIEQAKRDNPNLSVREAATISSINYVADWLVGMLRLVSI